MKKFPSTIKRISIYNASDATRELPLALLYAIRSVHPKPWAIDTIPGYGWDDDNVLYIIVCPAGLGSDEHVAAPKHYITYQLEPTAILERETYRELLRGAIVNWDYSERNVEYFRSRPELNINIDYLPIGYTPLISFKVILYESGYYNEAEKDVDVLFLGYVDAYPRRILIRDQLLAYGLKIWFVVGLNLEEMQQAIRRAKICLNYHVMDSMTNFETIRLNILLSNQACIVSEDIDDKVKNIYEDYMIITPYDKLVDICVKLSMQPELRLHYAMKSYHWYSTKMLWSNLVSFDKLLPEC